MKTFFRDKLFHSLISYIIMRTRRNILSTMNRSRIVLTLFIVLTVLGAHRSLAQSVTNESRLVSYQGEIRSLSGTPLSGEHIITTTLYTDPGGKRSVWSGNYQQAIAEGIFTILLGSGDYPIPSDLDMSKPMWIGVKIDNGEEMKPYSRLTGAAYAMAVPDKSITKDKLSDDVLQSMKHVGGSQNPQNDPNDWTRTGNTYSAGLGDFVGTAGGGAGDLELRVRNTRVMLYNDGTILTSPNITGGFNLNFIGLIDGSTIAGGGQNGAPNTIESDFGFIGSGDGNSISILNGNNADHSSIENGLANTIGVMNNGNTSFSSIGNGTNNFIDISPFSSIVNGEFNHIDINSDHSFIGGGNVAFIDNASFSVVGGGRNNGVISLGNPISHSAIVGGFHNRVNSSFAIVCGGDNNLVGNELDAIVGGKDNAITAESSFIGGGEGNIISGGILNSHSTIAGGFMNSTLGMASTIGGGSSNMTTADFTTISGGLGARARSIGQMANASGFFVGPGDAQTSVYVVSNTTTNAANTELFTGGGRMLIPANSAWRFHVLVVGTTAGGAVVGSYEFSGAIKNAPAGGGVQFVGGVVAGPIRRDLGAAAWVATCIADNVNGAFVVQVNGAPLTTIQWVARVETSEVIF